MSSLYQKTSSLPAAASFTGVLSSVAQPPSASSSFDASAASLPSHLDAAPYLSSYASADPFGFFGSSAAAAYTSAVASSWSHLDPIFASLKRPGEEVMYSGDLMSKRARFDLASTLPIYPQRPGEKDCVFYMRTRTCSYGATCKYDHPAWVPAGGIPDWKEVATPPTISEPLPVRAGEPDCAFYMKTGICKFGSKCKFNHPENRSTAGGNGDANANATQAASTVNTFASGSAAKVTTATVTNGDKGPVASPAAAFNAKGLPIRPGETECAFYAKTGSCKFGSACRFNHPEKPASFHAIPPQTQTAVTSLMSTLPGAYGNFSIFPGTFTDYGLSLPVSDFGLPTLMQTAALYPQRPGEPPCAFYMKTGVCKYTSTCKFHHPLNRNEVPQPESVKLTLAGFPRREGGQACPFYMKTGTCKYALTCKFDHPPPGEAAAKAIAEAGKPEQPEVGEVLPNY